jgi:hypothetical protein
VSAGYSGTPLARKLGIKAGLSVGLIDAPTDFAETLGELPDGVVLQDHAVGADLIIVFSTERHALVDGWASFTAAVGPLGVIWIAWPKKASNVPTDITGDALRAELLPSGWVDVKVCAIDEVWSGLKWVLRTALR